VEAAEDNASLDAPDIKTFPATCIVAEVKASVTARGVIPSVELRIEKFPAKEVDEVKPKETLAVCPTQFHVKLPNDCKRPPERLVSMKPVIKHVEVGAQLEIGIAPALLSCW
jgi:hypothetical protein